MTINSNSSYVRVLIDPEIKKKFHKKCLDAGVDMSEVVRDSIKKFIKGGQDGTTGKDSGKNQVD